VGRAAIKGNPPHDFFNLTQIMQMERIFIIMRLCAREHLGEVYRKGIGLKA